MPERPVKQLKKGREAALKRRTNHESSWRDAYRYCLPQRDIIDSPKPGQPKGNLVFDSTAISSLSRATAKVVDALFPPFQDFVKLEPGPAIPEAKKAEARKTLEDVSDVFHASHHRSNFQVTIHEMVLELMVGTGVMMVLEGPDDDPFNCVAVATPTVMLEEGPWGSWGGLYRDHKVTVPVARAQWERMGIKIPPDWADKEKEDPDTEVELCEVTYFDRETGKWYYELFRDKEEDKLLDKPYEYDGVSPWIVTRWLRAANEVYGRGPILFALPDIRTINRVVELLLMNASLSVSGVYTGVADGVFNPHTAIIAPGRVIPVARNAGHPQGASLAPLGRSADFEVSQFILEDMRGNIRRMMHDSGLPEPQGTPPSATEVIQRLRELAMEDGPAFARLSKELVEPYVIRGLQILNRKGLIDFPFAIDGTTIQIQLLSPLAQQQNLQEVQTTVQWVELLSMLGPEMVVFGAQIEKFPQWLGEKFGVDQDLIRSPANQADVEKLFTAIATRLMTQQGAPPQGGQTAA